MSSVSKVVFGNTTVMDITDSTVDAGSLLTGKKAYGANGEAVNGSLVVSDRIRWNEAKTSVKKNLLKNEKSSYSLNYVNFTINEDKSITITGTASSVTYFSFYENAVSDEIKDGDYIISQEGCTANAKVYINKYLNDTYVGSLVSPFYSESEKSFTIAYDNTYNKIQPAIVIPNGATVNTTVKVMIRRASIEDDTYVPYIPDNVELNSKKADVSSLATVATSGSYSDLSSKPDLQIESKFISAYGNVGRDANTVLDNALCYASTNTPPTSIGGYSDGSMSLISQRRNNSWTAQIAQRYDTGEIFVRGQASGTWSPWKRVSTEFYLDQSVTLSTSADTTVTFTNANIHADSAVDPWASIYGLVASNVVTTEGQCVVTFPKQDTAATITCRIYIK